MSVKQQLIDMLGNLVLDIESLEGNEDALAQAMDHIEKAIDLLDKYAIDE